MYYVRILNFSLFLLLLLFFIACSSDDQANSIDITESNDVILIKDIVDTDILEDIIVEDVPVIDTFIDISSDIANDTILFDTLFSDELSDSLNDDGSDILLKDEGYEIIDVFEDIESIDGGWDINLADGQIFDDVGSNDTGTTEDYDRFLAVSHPYGPDGATCGRDIEFFIFSKEGILVRPDQRIEIGECPTKVKFSPDGRYLFVITNNSHNPQAGTQRVFVFEKNNENKFSVVKEFDQFSLQNPEYIVFNHSGDKAYVVDYNIEGEGGIHILEKGFNGWEYKNEVMLALPKAMVVLPDDRYAIIIGGKDPNDTAVMDLVNEKIIAQYDLFSDFVDALGPGITSQGDYIAVPNSSPYSEIGNSLGVIKIEYISQKPVPSLKNILKDVNEPSAALFTSDDKYLVVTNFSKNYTSLYSFANESFNYITNLTSMPLADTMTVLRKGAFKDYFFVNALSDIHILKIENNQLLRVQKMTLGDGYQNMLWDIDIEP